MGVDHGGGNIAVAEELLDGAYVVARFEEVGGEAMAEAVTGGWLGEAGRADGLVEGALEDGFVEVVAAELAGGLVAVCARCEEEPLPGKVAACPGELS